MLLKRSLLLIGGIALAFMWGGQNANAQGAFTITSSSFKDGERLPAKMAGNNKQNPNCVGENVSPALSWANPPAGTKSYVLLMSDPEGRAPAGVSHCPGNAFGGDGCTILLRVNLWNDCRRERNREHAEFCKSHHF